MSFSEGRADSPQEGPQHTASVVCPRVQGELERALVRELFAWWICLHNIQIRNSHGQVHLTKYASSLAHLLFLPLHFFQFIAPCATCSARCIPCSPMPWVLQVLADHKTLLPETSQDKINVQLLAAKLKLAEERLISDVDHVQRLAVEREEMLRSKLRSRDEEIVQLQSKREQLDSVVQKQSESCVALQHQVKQLQYNGKDYLSTQQMDVVEQPAANISEITGNAPEAMHKLKVALSQSHAKEASILTELKAAKEDIDRLKELASNSVTQPTTAHVKVHALLHCNNNQGYAEVTLVAKCSGLLMPCQCCVVFLASNEYVLTVTSERRR